MTLSLLTYYWLCGCWHCRYWHLIGSVTVDIVVIDILLALWLLTLSLLTSYWLCDCWHCGYRHLIGCVTVDIVVIDILMALWLLTLSLLTSYWLCDYWHCRYWHFVGSVTIDIVVIDISLALWLLTLSLLTSHRVCDYWHCRYWHLVGSVTIDIVGIDISLGLWLLTLSVLTLVPTRTLGLTQNGFPTSGLLSAKVIFMTWQASSLKSPKSECSYWSGGSQCACLYDSEQRGVGERWPLYATFRPSVGWRPEFQPRTADKLTSDTQHAPSSQHTTVLTYFAENKTDRCTFLYVTPDMHRQTTQLCCRRLTLAKYVTYVNRV